MNSLINAENDVRDRFEEYEELLIRRDQLIKESGSYMIAYTREFGDLVIENYKLKIECIKTKKTISYCRRRMNRGLPIDTKVMMEEVQKEMYLYYLQFKDMLAENENAKAAKQVGEFCSRRAKKIYRRLAKLIHPDINKRTSGSETLTDLWVRIENAYMACDVELLEDLEALVYKALDELGEDSFEFDHTGLEDRIERLESRINEIVTTTPYTYGELLRDEDKKQAHLNALREEKKDFESYLEELKKTLDDMLKGGGLKMIWKMQ